MRGHFLYVGVLLFIALVFARPEARADCGEWNKPLVFVTTSWTAAQMCEAPDWKPGSALLHALSLGSSLGLYPWDAIQDPSCIAFIGEALDEAKRLFSTDPQRCRNVNTWLNDPEMHRRLVWLGVAQ